jgi:hypothetical protein
MAVVVSCACMARGGGSDVWFLVSVAIVVAVAVEEVKVAIITRNT